jgi:hypothetical protein
MQEVTDMTAITGFAPHPYLGDGCVGNVRLGERREPAPKPETAARIKAATARVPVPITYGRDRIIGALCTPDEERACERLPPR